MSFLDTKKIKISDVTVEDNTAYFQTKSLSGKYQKRVVGPQFFSLKFTANWMSDDISDVKRFIAEHKFNTPFEFPMSYFTQFNGVASSVVSSQKVNKGSRLIPLGSFIGTLPAGTVVQFQNHSKLYTITEAIIGGENATAKIFPALYQDVNQGEKVNYQNVKGKFVLTNEKFTFPVSAIGKFTFTALEYIL
ncbi:hypothetical protein EC840_104229 [Rahnella sp. JUb53]|uniref:hypothetical protein n=1 Tax=Rahnella sp. JUb53 TaxID=2485128 RepID=UPI00104732B8|nr:hypothetical protein [Rahnella sp. JUb53]TCQ89323.1 hypothetical protein EC840_104229 [Rahnella sp. JUb53]